MRTALRAAAFAAALPFALLAVAPSPALGQGQGQPPAEQVVLAPGRLAAGPAEDVLPAGAVVHLRVTHLARLLETLDGLIMSFVPEAVVPEEMRAFLTQPKPVLAWVGAEAFGETLTPELIARALGLQPDRPISVTIYSPERPGSFVVALPMADPVALTGLLHNIFRPRAFVARPLPEGDAAYYLAGLNPDLPEDIFIACSADTAYLTGDPDLLMQVIELPADAPRLARDPALGRALADAPEADLVLVASAAAFKPMLDDLMRYKTMPPELIADARAYLDAELDPTLRARFEARLQAQLGLGLAEMLDVTECVATASWEVLFGFAMKEARAFHGVSVALDLGEALQRAHVSIYSDRIDPAGLTQPIPMDALEGAVAALPGDRRELTASGQAPPPTPSRLQQAWVSRVRAKLDEKGLPTELLDAIAAHQAKRRPSLPLEARVPFSLSTNFQGFDAGLDRDFASLGEYASFLVEQATGAPVLPLTIVPKQAAGFLARQLQDEAAALNADVDAGAAIAKRLSGSDSLLATSHRTRFEALEAGVTRHVVEKVYLTRGGLFGYDEHELINRRFLLERTVGPHLFIQDAPGGAWLAGYAPAGPRPLSAATQRILSAVPAGASHIVFSRPLPTLLDAVDVFAKLEAVAHAELSAYLASAQAVIDGHAGHRLALAAALADLEAPSLVQTLNVDASGQAYAVLVGNLRFPRPRVMPVAVDLLAGVAAGIDTVGGGAVYTRARPGCYEIGVVQASDGLALLVKSTGDRLFKRYLDGPDGPAALQRALTVPGDGDAAASEALLRTATWEVFQR